MKDGDEIQSPDPVDPLQGLSGIALFPRTFRDFKKKLSKSSNPDDLEAVHESMKSMVLRSPNKLVGQAKTIIDGVSELLNTNFSSSVAIEKLNKTIDETGRGNPQERRPALRRKRPRFSLKPNSSQPAASLEPSLDIDKLEDPEDYFLAHEKLENAKKELQRQKGSDLSSLNEYNPTKAERLRRPGLLGKSASYKHHYSSMSHEKNDTFMVSQETSELAILSQSNHSSEPETAAPNDEVKQRDLSGSVAETENRVNDLLDELLSDRRESLDGAGALSFLQEHLQIKPIDLDKLCLPDFHDVGKDFMDMKEKLPKPHGVLSDVQNMLKRISDKTPMKDKPVAGSSINAVGSPTPPKSPFASISLLKRSILKSRGLSHDPFTALNLSPVRNPSIVEHFDQGSDQFDSRMHVDDSGDLKSTRNEHVDTVGDRSSPDMIARIHPSDKCLNKDLGTLGSSDNLRSTASQSDLEDKDRDSDMEDTVVNDHDSRISLLSDILMSRPNENRENEGDIPQEAVSSGPHDANIIKDSSMLYTDDQTDGPNEIQENVEDPSHNVEPDVNMDVPASGTSKSSQIQLGTSGSAAVSLHATDDELSKSPDEAPAQHNEKIQKPSMGSPNKQSKAKRPPRAGHRSNAFSRRQSLAEAGTSWAFGVRRSNRIKMRPLEYWKGERFLYGRVHKSLTTVIGVKYISPAKGDGKPAFRVKSFSDKYNELVELAALH